MIYIDTSEDEEYFKDSVIPEALSVYLQKAPQFHGQELLYFYHPMGPAVILGHYQDAYHEVNFPYLREHNMSARRLAHTLISLALDGHMRVIGIEPK